MVVDISVKVVEQGEALQKVEENIDFTNKNVVKAEEEIVKANVISKDNHKNKYFHCN